VSHIMIQSTSHAYNNTSIQVQVL